jgi:hypothetical protein
MVREVGSQPSVPVSAIPAAPAERAPRNVRREIAPPSPPLPAHFSAKSVLSPCRPRTRSQNASPPTEPTTSGTPENPGNLADLLRKPTTFQAGTLRHSWPLPLDPILPTGRDLEEISQRTVSSTSSTVVMPWAALASPSCLRGIMPDCLASASISSAEAPLRIRRRSCSSTSMISYTPIRPA